MDARMFAITLARVLPVPLKQWIHRHRTLDGFSRSVFAKAIEDASGTIPITGGVLKGLKLAASPHISHAHILGTYEAEMQQALEGLLQPGAVCYDLGASIGYFSLLMARKARQVYSFEPAPHAAEQVRRNLSVNRFENVELIPSPVSDSKKIVTFSLTDVAYGSGIVAGETTKWPTLQLETLTLDEFAQTHPLPDLMKIDVEGEEGRVLEGARSILERRKPAICCEVHSDDAARTVGKVLGDYEYRIVSLEGTPVNLDSVRITEPIQIRAQA
jgi:FkbM family methyltransferase